MRWSPLIALSLAACASAPRFEHASASQQAFLKDRAECLVQAKQAAVVNDGLYHSCMAARGYKQDPNGRLIVPADTLVETR